MDAREQANRLIDLQKMLLQFLEIERLIYLPDGTRTDRRETDTEHSFHLAMLAWYLSTHYPHLDQSKVVQYALAHDLVEIYAGDVMAIGRTVEQQRIKEQREKEALARLENEWPDFPSLIETIKEYEDGQTPESSFVRALDKIMPMMHQLLSAGKTWKKLDVRRSDVIKNKDEKTAHSKEIHAIWKVLRDEIQAHDDWFNPKNAD